MYLIIDWEINILQNSLIIIIFILGMWVIYFLNLLQLFLYYNGSNMVINYSIICEYFNI